jgi:transcriptional regulator with XRE-family HTH domain
MPVDSAKRAIREERAARIRAARAYAKVTQDAIAEALGQSTISVKRMEKAEKDISVDDLWTIADLCGVPREFMTDGFQSVPEELRRIHERFDVLTQRIRWSVAASLAEATAEHLQGMSHEFEPESPESPESPDVANGNAGNDA